jgi:hypothetical protein
MIAAQPICIYCGGATPATTVEHMPSRIIFDGKQRPKGLEFSACEPCNGSTRRAETIIAMLSRVYTTEQGYFDRKELNKICMAAFRNNPGLAAEMHMDQVAGLKRLGNDAYKLPSWHLVHLGGPICQSALDSFGKKLALSLHFEATGLIVPVGGAVLLKHYSNVDAFTGFLPDDLISLFGQGKTLRMGRKEVGNQFRYSSAFDQEEPRFSAHLAVFRESFAILSVVAHNPIDLPSDASSPNVHYVAD